MKRNISIYSLTKLLLIFTFLFQNANLSAQDLGPQPSASVNTVALHANGIVYAWGSNQYGRLGDGTYTNRITPIKPIKGDYPGTTYLGDDTNNKITAVSLGSTHSIALAENGYVFAWGKNNYGQIGRGSSSGGINYPVGVFIGEYNGTTYLGDDSNNKIISLALGKYHSLTLAADGLVYSFGRNSFGALGDATITERTTPVKVKKGAYSGTTYIGDDTNNKVTVVAAAGDFSVALVADGTVYTWGYNASGQLGNGTTTQSTSPVKVLMGAYSGTTYLGDDSNNKISAIAAGNDFSIALTTDGTVYTWGGNGNGQLGNGTTNSSSTPIRVLKGAYSGTTYLGDDTNNKIIKVAAGAGHSIALASDGTVYTWGFNDYGQLGDGTGTSENNRSTPVKVLKGVYNGASYLGDDTNNKINSIASGYRHSIALAADGSVYTWGYNGNGQLGDSTTSSSPTPVKVRGESGTGDLSLPVELTSFIAKQEKGNVVLQWVTESEIENLGFILERRNFKFETGNWEEIASYLTHPELQGQGNVTHRTEYQFVDTKVLAGVTYDYRLADVNYNGVVEYHELTSLTIEQYAEIPDEFTLSQNYPNPFNPITTFKYGLPQPSQVTLKIYNAIGREVGVLVNEHKTVGYYQINWDASGVSSGIYFYHLKANGFSRVKKCLVIK